MKRGRKMRVLVIVALILSITSFIGAQERLGGLATDTDTFIAEFDATPTCPVYTCSIHGETDKTFTIWSLEDCAIYCAECLVDKLDKYIGRLKIKWVD